MPRRRPRRGNLRAFYNELGETSLDGPNAGTLPRWLGGRRSLLPSRYGRPGSAWFTLAVSASVAVAQPLAPIADRVESPILPSGISELPVVLNGQLAYTFRDEDGTSALHCVGDCMLQLGDQAGLSMTGQELIVWINPRSREGRAYRHLQVLLWKEASIEEPAGTYTSGPILFATLDTFGRLEARVDDLAYRSSAETQAYHEGNAIRKALTERMLEGTDENTPLSVIDVTRLAQRERPPSPRPTIQVRSQGELTMTTTQGGEQVLIVTGGVYLSRGVPESGAFLEIQADRVVVFLPPAASPSAGAGEAEGSGEELDAKRRTDVGLSPEVRPNRGGATDSTIPAGQRQLLSTAVGEMAVHSAYLEGDVILREGPNMIRAAKLYYDFLRNRAVILDAVARTTVAQRNIPLYIRADEIRQLSENHFVASDAIVTTSEFHTPHYHVGAERVEIINRTPPDLTGRRSGFRAGTVALYHATLNLEGHPLLYWPYIRGSVDTSETAIRSIRSGFSDDFGVELETKWQLFDILGLETPDGVDSTLSLDYFSERGPAVGVGATYQRDRYYGLLRSYLMSDEGRDFLGRNRRRPAEEDVRGRLLVRHRQYLEDDWELTLELSYISHEGFLEEFFESEFDNEKEQETLLYLKKQRENWAVTALAQARILDFFTQTERAPDVALFVLGEPLGNAATWYTENRLGVVRYRPANPSLLEWLRGGPAEASGSVGRADTRHELDFPFDLGPLRFVPFVMVRGTAWDDSPEHGGVGRVFTSYGIHGSMYLSRVYPAAQSTLWDIDGIRHVVKPDITAWISHSSRDPDELFPFDETVEEINEVDGVSLGLRQRWQTKRGRNKTRRTVDLLTLDLEATFFNDTNGEAITNGFASFSRPENSIARNGMNSSVIWRINDRTALLSEMNYDVNDGEMDIFNVSLAVERPPRMSYLVGYRLIDESDSELFGFDMNYRLTEKHTLAMRELFDLNEGRTLDFTVALIRKFPHWFGAVSFAFDEPEDDFGVSLSIWPEGFPQAALGSRRFAGLSGGTLFRSE